MKHHQETGRRSRNQNKAVHVHVHVHLNDHGHVDEEEKKVADSLPGQVGAIRVDAVQDDLIVKISRER